MTSQSRDIAATLRERILPQGRSRYGLVVGIDQYADSRLDLRCAAADARLVHRLMVDPECGLFPEANVELLLNEAATQQAVWRSLAGLRRKAGPEDTVWVYFAGHAAPEDDQTYWVTHDSDVNDLFSTGLGSEQISGVLSRVAVDRQVVMLDCCHAAAIACQQNPTRSVLAAEELYGSFQGKGSITLCSSDGGQRSVELAEHGHGAFTYFLERGLRGEADLNGDGVVTADELWRYLQDKVSDAARKVGVQQTPLLIGQLSHGLPLSVSASAISARVALVDVVHSLIGLESGCLSTDEARFCLELIQRGASTPAERALLAMLQEAAQNGKPGAGLTLVVSAAMSSVTSTQQPLPSLAQFESSAAHELQMESQDESLTGHDAPNRVSEDAEVGGIFRLIMNNFCLRPEEVSMEASFTRDYGADALDVVELVMTVEEAFGLSIPEEVACQIDCAQQLVDLVKGKPMSGRPESTTYRSGWLSSIGLHWKSFKQGLREGSD